ncbi:Platelet-derived growth factor receptor-like protein [Liparis tanakae]|uniref:Platelet-derived growth factor receptor-like protein n=1 Tax=Liparis tanakae TaxID=230148 RepID=A0A4Z2EQ82_9TELE|nr:Platelet-derived growth factor receptor-like protein [Liparis tanakae]
MPRAKGSEPRGGAVLSALLLCGFICDLGRAPPAEDRCSREEAQAQQTHISPPGAPGPGSGGPHSGTQDPAARGTSSGHRDVTCGARRVQVLSRGKFKKVGDSLRVRAGGPLELRCRGRPVQWSVPKYLEEDDDGRLRLVQHERYGALTLLNSTGADTGRYTCYPATCEDADCRRHYDGAASVFVFFPDPRELFVPSSDYYEAVQLRSDRPALLPCQVTSPDAAVTLHREFPPEEVAVDGSEISFHAQRGFTLHRPRPRHAGPLFCVASLGGLRQSSTTYMLLYAHCEPPSP